MDFEVGTVVARLAARPKQTRARTYARRLRNSEKSTRTERSDR